MNYLSECNSFAIRSQVLGVIIVCKNVLLREELNADRYLVFS